LDDENPLPTPEAEHAIHSKNGGGPARSNSVGDRLRDKEGRDDPAAILGGKPVSEIEDHAGKETGFCCAEQKADDQKAGGPCDQGHETGNDPPGDHDPRDPDPCADLFQDQIAWDLEQEVAEEKDAGAPAIEIGAEAEILVHGERSNGNVAA